MSRDRDEAGDRGSEFGWSVDWHPCLGVANILDRGVREVGGEAFCVRDREELAAVAPSEEHGFLKRSQGGCGVEEERRVRRF
jgi:hypothetical protein